MANNILEEVDNVIVNECLDWHSSNAMKIKQELIAMFPNFICYAWSWQMLRPD